MAANPAGVRINPAILAELISAESKSLLNTISRLQKLHVGDSVELPQIVVVGDQFAGKSAVLEAITGIPLPYYDEQCSLLATKIVLRQSSQDKVDVSVHCVNDSGAPQQPFHRSAQGSMSITSIIDEAKAHAGLLLGNYDLHVEISGPDLYPLTLVELPGSVPSMAARTSQDERPTVYEGRIEDYMQRENSIILATVAADGQLAEQQALIREVKLHDPSEKRTLGVITMPDYSRRGPEECKFRDLAKGCDPDNDLRHGWVALRNRGWHENIHLRDRTEKWFFDTGDWSSVPKEKRGIEALRKKLSAAILERIRTVLPGLVRQIEAKIVRRKDAIKRLGSTRTSTWGRRLYLNITAMEFQRLARDAISGRYVDGFFNDSPMQDNRRLRALVRNLNCAFDATLRAKGRLYDIKWDGEDHSSSPPNNQDDNPPRYLRNCMDLYKDVSDPGPISEPRLNAKVKRLAWPGMTVTDLVLRLFRLQSSSWQNIARLHVVVVLDSVQKFVDQAFEHLFKDDKATLSLILRTIVQPFFEKKKTALYEKLEELLRPYTHGDGLYLDAELYSRVSRRAGRDRVAEQPGKGTAADGAQPKELAKTQRIVSPDKLGTERVIDTMVAYYDTSLRTFTENVISLAIESCLISDITDILTPAAVCQMPDEKVDELATEPKEVWMRRQRLENEVRALQEELQICRWNGPRVLPFRVSSSLGGQKEDRPVSYTLFGAGLDAPQVPPGSPKGSASTPFALLTPGPGTATPSGDGSATSYSLFKPSIDVADKDEGGGDASINPAEPGKPAAVSTPSAFTFKFAPALKSSVPAPCKTETLFFGNFTATTPAKNSPARSNGLPKPSSNGAAKDEGSAGAPNPHLESKPASIASAAPSPSAPESTGVFVLGGSRATTSSPTASSRAVKPSPNGTAKEAAQGRQDARSGLTGL